MTAPADEVPSPALAAFEAMWAGLSSSEREAFEVAALAAAPAFLQKQYQEGSGSKGSFWRVTRYRILLAHFSATGGASL